MRTEPKNINHINILQYRTAIDLSREVYASCICAGYNILTSNIQCHQAGMHDMRLTLNSKLKFACALGMWIYTVRIITMSKTSDIQRPLLQSDSCKDEVTRKTGSRILP